MSSIGIRNGLSMSRAGSGTFLSTASLSSSILASHCASPFNAPSALILPYAAFARAIAYWKQLADPDGAEEDDEKRRERRDVYLEKSFGGRWVGQITLKPGS